MRGVSRRFRCDRVNSEVVEMLKIGYKHRSLEEIKTEKSKKVTKRGSGVTVAVTDGGQNQLQLFFPFGE